MSKLIDFYTGSGTDHLGRTFEQILELPDEEWNACHDFIQWLFPSPRPSYFFPTAPLLTADDISIFKTSPTLQINMKRALIRYFDFLGFALDSKNNGEIVYSEKFDFLGFALDSKNNGEIVYSDKFDELSNRWLNINDHNYNRLTRVMLSLRLCGMPATSYLVFLALLAIRQKYPDKFGELTILHWIDSQAGRTDTLDYALLDEYSDSLNKETNEKNISPSDN
jgi:Opioid growth factor receptor (OGFr) conserved region